MSASGSRPAYLDEFERKLAATLAQQADAKKTRFASMRSSDANLPVMSSPSLGEAFTRSSGGGDRLNVGPLQPSSETRERETHNHEALTVSVRDADVAIPVGPATEPLTDGSEAAGATGRLPHGPDIESAEQSAAANADLADASSEDCASRSARRTEEPISVPAEMVETLMAELSRAISDALPQVGGGPDKGIAAASVISKTARALNFHGREKGVVDATKRGFSGRRLKALALTASVAMAGVVFICLGGILSPAGEVPGADGSSLRQNMTSGQAAAAEQAPSAGVLARPAASGAESDLLKDRPDVNSAAVVATPTAPQTAEAAGVDAIQPAGGHSSGTSPVPIVSTPDAATPATPPMPQSFDIKSVPTLSPQPAPITNPISPAEFATDGPSEGHAPSPTAKPVRHVHDVGTSKPVAPKGEVPMKVVSKPSMRAAVTKTKNDATSPYVAVRAPSQPLPLGKPAMHDNAAKEPNAAQAVVESAATAATPAATLQPSGLY